jgi:hypothetical protein
VTCCPISAKTNQNIQATFFWRWALTNWAS